MNWYRLTGPKRVASLFSQGNSPREAIEKYFPPDTIICEEGEGDSVGFRLQTGFYVDVTKVETPNEKLV